MKSIIVQLVQLASRLGLRMMTVASAVVSANRAMWKQLGVTNIRGELVNKIPHPVNHDKALYILTGVPHLLKNIKAALILGLP